MKTLVLLSLLMVSSSALAGTKIPRLVTCTEDRGYQLVIEDTGLEGFQVALEVSIRWQGHTYDFAELRVVENSQETLRLEGHASSGNVLTVTLDKVKMEAFRQEAANGGMSPLPGMIYRNCRIE